jgi:polyhydroxyalkanoate synthesis repressor PhaR
MISPPDGQKPVLQIRKYSNRRFYDTTHSRHLTLEEIRDLIKEGHGVQVSDGSGTDITTKVLAQMILDFDGPKIELFPAVFLTEIIRVNDLLVKGFYEKFFHQAHRAFLDYQKLMESHLKHGGGLPSMFPMPPWSQPPINPAAPGPAASDGETQPIGNLSSTLEDLQRQVDALQSRLAKSAPTRSPGSRRRRRKRKIASA